MELIEDLDQFGIKFIKTFRGVIVSSKKIEKINEYIRRQTTDEYNEKKGMNMIKGRKGKLEYLKEKDVYRLKLYLMPFEILAIVVPKQDKVNDEQPDFLILKEDIMIGALWNRVSSKGSRYLSGYIDYVFNDKGKLFINIFKTDDKKYIVYVDEPDIE